jgi:hypothetical protein
MPDSISNVLRDIKISELPVADQANATDQLEANQSGTTRRITLDQVSSLVASIGGSGSQVYVGDTPPASVPSKTLWWNSVLGALYIYYDDGDTVQWVPASPLASGGTITPELFGAVGDGVADDSAAIYALLAHCAATGTKFVGTPGAVYRLADGFTGYIRTEFDGNGCQFIGTNAGQSTDVPLFVVESLEADIETVSLETLNGWAASLYSGSKKIPELAGQSGWSYAFEYFGQDMLVNVNGVHDIPVGEAFEVIDNLGNLNKEIVGRFTMPFSGTYPPGWVIVLGEPAVTGDAPFLGYRRRIRNRMVVKDLFVRIAAPAVGAVNHRNKVVITRRPHTTMVGCVVTNESPVHADWRHCQIDTCFSVSFTTTVTYENCRAERTDATADQSGSGCYGFHIEYADSITYRNCTEGQNRRGLDAIGGANIVIDGGSYPDGVGGHWIDGLHIYGRPYLATQHPTNLNVIHVSGSDVNVESAIINVTSVTGAVFRARQDRPEVRGICRLGPGVEITIDNTTDPIGEVNKEMMGFTIPAFAVDPGRDLWLPTIIDFTPGLIRQIGATSDNKIYLVVMPERTSAQVFARPIHMPAEINVEPRGVLLEGGNSVGATSRMVLWLNKADTSVGDPCRVRVNGLRRLQINNTAGSTSADTAVGRYDVELRNLAEAGTIVALPGIVRRLYLENCHENMTLTLTGGGLTSPASDEVVEWNIADVVGSYTPDVAWPGTLASSNLEVDPVPAVAFYTYDSKYTTTGRKTRITVHGSVTINPVAAGSTTTILTLSLPPGLQPPGTTFLSYLVGIGTRAQADIPPLASVFMETALKRAQIQFPSNTTAVFTLLYQYSYYF